MKLCSTLCSEGTNKARYVRVAAEEERGVGPLGRLATPLFLPSNALTRSNKLITALGITPTLRFLLKVVAGQREERGGHLPTTMRV